jgi:4a-hydroxytetrahydrobiopterin dehydratase
MNKDLEDKISALDNWHFNEIDNCLEKKFEFKSYLKNISFVNAIAFIANKQNHHPDLIVKFNLCHIKITTHDENSLTEKDFKLASAIDQLNY